MAAHHQVAALDPGNVDPRRHLATDGRADRLEPWTVTVLAGQFVELVPDVLAGQRRGSQQDQQDPQQALAPVDLGFLPAELNRVVDQVEQRLLAVSAAAARAQAWFAAFDQLRLGVVQVVVRLPGRQTFAGQFVIIGMQRLRGWCRGIEIVVEYIQRQRRLGALARCRREVQGFLFDQRWLWLVELGNELFALGGRAAEQAVGPVLVVLLGAVAVRAEAVFARGGGLELGRRLDFALFQARQFLIQIELVEVQFCGAPLVLAGRLRGLHHRLDRRRLRRRVLRRALLQQLPGGVEHLQAGAATHHTAGHAQLIVADAKAGLAMRALGDETVGHAAVRVIQKVILGALSGGDH
ncbi:hypothetical protein D3C81_875370 [compost metagenome]